MKKFIIIAVAFLAFSIVNCKRSTYRLGLPLTKEECAKDETKQWNEGEGVCEDKQVEVMTKEECEKDETKQWNAEANEGKGVCETKVETSSEASYIDECNKIHDELGACYERSFSLPVAEIQKCDNNHDESEEELFKKFLKAEQLSEMQARSREIRNPVIGPECSTNTVEEWLECHRNTVSKSRQVFCVASDQINLEK